MSQRRLPRRPETRHGPSPRAFRDSQIGSLSHPPSTSLTSRRPDDDDLAHQRARAHALTRTLVCASQVRSTPPISMSQRLYVATPKRARALARHTNSSPPLPSHVCPHARARARKGEGAIPSARPRHAGASRRPPPLPVRSDPSRPSGPAHAPRAARPRAPAARAARTQPPPSILSIQPSPIQLPLASPSRLPPSLPALG